MTAKMAVLMLAVIVALGGAGAGFVRSFDDGEATAVEPIDLRKDDTGAELVAERRRRRRRRLHPRRRRHPPRRQHRRPRLHPRQRRDPRRRQHRRPRLHARQRRHARRRQHRRRRRHVGQRRDRGRRQHGRVRTGAGSGAGRLRRRGFRWRLLDGLTAPVGLLLVGVGALCAPAPAAAADALPRVSIEVRGAIPDGKKETARMTVRDRGRAVYRGRIGIEVRGQSSQRFPKQAWSLELRDRKGDNRDVVAARDAGRRRLDPLRGLQRQDADAQRARVRDGAPAGPVREPDALRRGPARTAATTASTC